MVPLEGIRVVDLSRLLPGPYATLLMSDLGAEVIKVEEPQQGDYIRSFMPQVDGESVIHHLVNRGKKSVAVDLKSSAGRALFLRLVKTADIVIESFRPGVLDRLGIGFDVLSSENPRIILCSLTGYGQTGPRRDFPGHDINYIGYTGILSLNGNGDGVPLVPSVPIADIGGGGAMAVIGMLAGLLARNRTHEAQWIDVSMLDGSASWLTLLLAASLDEGGIAQQTALLSGGHACYTTYPTSDDRYMALGAVEAKFWRNFCQALDIPELAARQLAPLSEQQRMKETITEIIRQHTQEYWTERFQAIDACCTPVLTVDEALRDEQLTARGMFVRNASEVPHIGRPIRWSNQEAPPLNTHAPRLGEQTFEILEGLGIGADDRE